MDRTTDLLRPYQSTRDLDGIRTDREEVQDIAYDGEPVGEWRERRTNDDRPIRRGSR